MKALGISERRGLERYVTQQINYSLLIREAEYELVPIAHRRGRWHSRRQPAGRRLSQRQVSARRIGGRWHPLGHTEAIKVGFDTEHAFDVMDAVCEIAAAHHVSPSQVALNWLTRRAGVSSVILGARTEDQLRDNLGATDWTLAPDELQRLNDLTQPRILYPYWHQQFSGRLNPAD